MAGHADEFLQIPERPRDDGIKLLRRLVLLCARVYDRDVCEFQTRARVFHEARLLAGRFDQREFSIAIDDCEGQTGKTCSRAHIGDRAPMQVRVNAERVEKVLSNRIDWIRDRGQVDPAVPVLKFHQQLQQLLALPRLERNSELLHALCKLQLKLTQFFTSAAMNWLTDNVSSLRGSTKIRRIESDCFAEKCPATLASNFFTSTGMPSARRLR